MPLSLSASIGAHNPDYYDRNFRRTVEDHLDYLISGSDNNLMTLTPDEGIRYEGDFFGLLKSKSIHRDLWWPIMRANNLNSPFDFTQEHLSIYIVDDVKLSKLRSTWRATQKTSK